jgi:hypothetical protein
VTYSARADDGALLEHLTVPQGAAWSRTWPVTDGIGAPLSLDGWSARAQLRLTADDAAVVFEWNTTAGTGIGSVVAAGAAVTIALTGAESATWGLRRGVYDLYLFDPNGVPTRLVEGTFTLSPSVTHG